MYKQVIAMFMGEYNHTVDAKGRLIVPSRFREQLGDEFVITKGLDNCLFVYDNSEWTALEERRVGKECKIGRASWRERV